MIDAAHTFCELVAVIRRACQAISAANMHNYHICWLGCVGTVDTGVFADLQAMVRDRKRNPMLLTAAKLRRMLAAFDSRGANDRCRFRVPNKRLW